MTRLEALIDHAAELQQDVDRLNAELVTLALAGLALALLVALMGWQIWRG